MQIDPNTRLANIVVPLPPGSGVLPGAVVRGDIVLRDRARVLAVPRSAVLNENGRAYLYVVTDGHARQRWVETGQESGEFVEIVDGVSAQEAVVTQGNHELSDGMAVRTMAISK